MFLSLEYIAPRDILHHPMPPTTCWHDEPPNEYDRYWFRRLHSNEGKPLMFSQYLSKHPSLGYNAPVLLFLSSLLSAHPLITLSGIDNQRQHSPCPTGCCDWSGLDYIRVLTACNGRFCWMDHQIFMATKHVLFIGGPQGVLTFHFGSHK